MAATVPPTSGEVREWGMEEVDTDVRAGVMAVASRVMGLQDSCERMLECVREEGASLEVEGTRVGLLRQVLTCKSLLSDIERALAGFR